jgi:hypothetical protein
MHFLKHVNMGQLKKKVHKNLKHISIKSTKSNLQMCITWPKKSRKRKREWTKACSDFGIHPRKLNTPIKTRYFLNFFF